MKKAAIYARFSSHNQREASIDQQMRICRQWAQDNGYKVVREYSDSAISGTTDKRPSFQRMICESEKRLFDTVLVYAHDRFARNRYDSATYKAKLKRNGVKVIAVTMPLDDSPEAVLIESMMEGYAEYYSVNLSRSVQRGMDDNAAKGLCNGPLPLGYKSDGGTIVLDPVGAKAVQMIFDLYDCGTPKSEIVEKLNAAGYKTRAGREFVANSVWRILCNERYTGVYIYKDTRIPDAIPRIIQQDQWERVAQKLEHRKMTKGHSKAMEEYLLSGKVFCGACGAPLIGESGKSGGNGQIYRYYKCSKKKHAGAKACCKRPERKEELEQMVLAYICNEVMTDENIKLIAAECYRQMDEECQDKSLLNQLQSDLKDTTSKIKNILNVIEAGHYNAAMMDRLTQLEELQADLECKVVAEQLKKPEFTQDHIEFWLQSFRGGHITDPEYARGMVDSLINSIFVYDEGKEKGNERKIVIALNVKNSPTAVLKSSDLLQLVDQSQQNTNFIIRKGLVIVLIKEK